MTAPTVVAHRCGWCSAWDTPEDERMAAAGVLVSHGICPACRAKMDGLVEAVPRG